MEIAKFTKSEFGTLTTITNPKTGNTMFVASEVGKMWGHTNMTQVINRMLNEGDFKKVTKVEYPSFFKELVLNKMLSAKTQHIIFITESGLYKLALASNLEKAKPFRDWVTSEVLPSIRKYGYYSLADNASNIGLHTNIAVQKTNSKEINSKHLIEQGIEAVIEYNKTSCLLHTGKTPSQIKEEAKANGLKSTQRSSAKEVLRNTNPAVACAMSFTDSMVKKGFDLKTVSELSVKAAIPLFQGMIEMGARPPELYQ